MMKFIYLFHFLQVFSELPLDGLKKGGRLALQIGDSGDGMQVRAAAQPVQLLLQLRGLGRRALLLFDGLLHLFGGKGRLLLPGLTGSAGLLDALLPRGQSSMCGHLEREGTRFLI